MPNVTPCRNLVSERFPVASFVVDVPPERCFELACATDPRLFHPDQRARRTSRNFWTSRFGGLMRAPSGRATYLLPPEQLRNFAGAQRLYYALGTYGSPSGDRPQFTVSPAHPDRVPYVQISPDFTGRSLDRRRLGIPAPDPRYGRKPADLTWGGDLALARAAAPRQAPAVWRGVALDAAAPAVAAPTIPAPVPAPGTPGAAAVDEPSGCEHPDELLLVDHATVELPDAGGEPYGARRRIRPAQGARPAPAAKPKPKPGAKVLRNNPVYGRRGRALGGDDGAGDADGGSLALHDPDYSDDDDDDGAAAVAAGEAMAVRDLDLDAKFRIVQIVAAFESGLRLGDLDDPARRARVYGAANRNSDGAGLSWGLIQFTQRGGALGDVLAGCKRRDEGRFRAIFGGDADALLTACTAADESVRMQPVAGANLWEEPWLGRFRAAAAEAAFQAAQNQVAIERYFDPHLGFARGLGFDSERALAMLYDRCVQQGNGGGPRWIIRVLGPIHDQAADLPRALAALGAADLAAFQRSVPGLAADGRFGTETHAALVGALRGLGAASPFPIADRDAMLDALVAAAQSEAAAANDRQRLWMQARARRLASLRGSAEVSDDTFALA